MVVYASAMAVVLYWMDQFGIIGSFFRSDLVCCCFSFSKSMAKVACYSPRCEVLFRNAVVGIRTATTTDDVAEIIAKDRKSPISFTGFVKPKTRHEQRREMTNGRVLTTNFSIVQAIWGNSYPFLARPINLKLGKNVSHPGHFL